MRGPDLLGKPFRADQGSASRHGPGEIASAPSLIGIAARCSRIFSQVSLGLRASEATEEVRSAQFPRAESELDAEMVAIAGAIINQRTGAFDPNEYPDRKKPCPS